jgi:hypothetical protein
MTEAEWLACDDPTAMLDFLGDAAGERKLRLFVCACCREVWDLLDDPRSRQAVQVGEEFADSRCGLSVLEAACREADVAARTFTEEGRPGDSEAAWRAAWTAEGAASSSSPFRLRAGEAARTAAHSRGWGNAAVLSGEPDPDDTSPLNWLPGSSVWRACKRQEARMAAILRDVFRHPSHVTAVGPDWLAWQGGVVPKVASGAYDSRDFASLPVLSDALEEAGCTDADLLAHLRSPGPHVRGCWALDLILGKS